MNYYTRHGNLEIKNKQKAIRNDSLFRMFRIYNKKLIHILDI